MKKDDRPVGLGWDRRGIGISLGGGLGGLEGGACVAGR